MKRQPLHEIEPNRRGDLRNADGTCHIGYYTVQPAPFQWVAVGQVIQAPDDQLKSGTLLVASERDELSAIARLSQRCPMHGGEPNPPALDGELDKREPAT